MSEMTQMMNNLNGSVCVFAALKQRSDTSYEWNLRGSEAIDSGENPPHLIAPH